MEYDMLPKAQTSVASRDSTHCIPTSSEKLQDRKVSIATPNTKRSIQSVDPAEADPASKRFKSDYASTSLTFSGDPVVDDPTSRLEQSANGRHDSHRQPREILNKPYNPQSNPGGKAETKTIQNNRQSLGNGTASLLHILSNSQQTTHKSNNLPSNHRQSTQQPPIRAPPTASINLAPPPVLSNGGYPTICIFGNLFPTQGSIDTVECIKMSCIGTTFGRAYNNKYVHPDYNEMRIPKYAIDLRFWYPGLDEDIVAGNDWTCNPALSCFISTRTSRYIKVNGVRLMKGKDCWLYGKLRSGDVISVFELAEGQESKRGVDKRFLRFTCEFNIGGSRAYRKDPDDKFYVLSNKVLANVKKSKAH